MLSILYQFCYGLISAAKSGQSLPILTLLVIIVQPLLHSIITYQLVQYYDVDNAADVGHDIHYSMSTTILTKILQYNKSIMQINVLLFLIPGYTLLIYLYRHSVTTIFNKQIPPTMKECIPSFILHLQLLKPLEIIFRYLTFKFRVLPDIIVLGEVRCGTTSFCQHLATVFQESKMYNDDDDETNDECQYFIDCHTPFCLWAHPELDHKETFYFVGHYLRMVTPQCYRMCFPLYITKWWNEKKYYFYDYLTTLQLVLFYRNKRRRRIKKRKPLFISFDGCAQYLTSPTAPYLIAKAYREANQPPPLLVACIRDPTQQTLSWWKYENNAQEWGEAMGLKRWNTSLRSELYPPSSVQEAMEYTQSKFVTNAYVEAEKLFSKGNDNDNAKDGHKFLPSWSMTWPGGQLSGIGRNGKFKTNIMRYEKVFTNEFAEASNDQVSKFVNVLPLETLNNEAKLKHFLVDVMNKVSSRKNDKEKSYFQQAIQSFKTSNQKLSTVHRNPSNCKKETEINDEIIEMLDKYFHEDKEYIQKHLHSE